MKYNFDEIIDRRNTSCVKFDAVAERLVEMILSLFGWPIWIFFHLLRD